MIAKKNIATTRAPPIRNRYVIVAHRLPPARRMFKLRNLKNDITETFWSQPSHFRFSSIAANLQRYDYNSTHGQSLFGSRNTPSRKSPELNGHIFTRTYIHPIVHVAVLCHEN